MGLLGAKQERGNAPVSLGSVESGRGGEPLNSQGYSRSLSDGVALGPLEGSYPQTMSDVHQSSDGSTRSETLVLRNAVRQPVLKYEVPHPILVLAQRWPCWLVSIISLRLTVVGAYFPTHLHKFFKRPTVLSSWASVEAWMELVPVLPQPVIILGSGSLDFFKSTFLHQKTVSQQPFVFVVDSDFSKINPRRVGAYLSHTQQVVESWGFSAKTLRHKHFGGASNAVHVVIFNQVPSSVFNPGHIMERTLKHLLEPATRGRFKSIPEPPPLQGSASRDPIVVDNLLRKEGLYDVHHPLRPIAIPSVFSGTKWVARTPSLKELLRIFDIPVSMDKHIVPHQNSYLPFGIAETLSSVVITTIFRNWWGVMRGVERNPRDVGHWTTSNAPSTLKILVSSSNDTQESSSNVSNTTLPSLVTRTCSASSASSIPDSESVCSSDYSGVRSDVVAGFENSTRHDEDQSTTVTDTSTRQGVVIEFNHIPALNCRQPNSLSQVPNSCKGSSQQPRIRPLSEETRESCGAHVPTASPTAARLEKIKREHDLAKAVKSDDAEVPRHLWDERIFQGPISEEQMKALGTMRRGLLKVYEQNVVRDCRDFLRKTHGRKWYSLPRKSPDGNTTKFGRDFNATFDVLWRCVAERSDWFEYPVGSSLNFFRFPARYQNIAKEGVPVSFTQPGPTSMKAQPKMEEDARIVLADKISKVLRKRYIDEPNDRLRSLMAYFGVPKGVLEGVVQDWRVVYHAGANGLNECVWAPSFWLPNMATMLRMLDTDSLMEDRDMGEMFLNFPLHWKVRPFTGIDVGPLSLDPDEFSKRWYWWTRMLMGFRPSPYCAIKTYLVVEEVIRGDRHNTAQTSSGKDCNPFQWHSIRLNLPGTLKYNPNQAWISKRRIDGTLASDFIAFVDDQRIAGATSQRVTQASHRVSTIETYLGVQDALRKIRGAGGVRHPGAWAGGVIINDEKEGLLLLTSQDKWDKMKSIIQHWLTELRAGRTELDHKLLRSHRGFLVYCTGPYPALVPYLKGIHLSLESWRPFRDKEGWKIPQSEREPETTESESLVDLGDDDDLSVLEFKRQVAPAAGPDSGLTRAVPRLLSDLEALEKLSRSDKPLTRVVRGKVVLTAIYGFGDASSGGFGASIERKDGIHGRFGLWGRDEETASSNYRELLNLVETVEEEAALGNLNNAELWLFTDNSTAESCFEKGSSTSKTLHQLILRLRQVEMKVGLKLYLVHVAGTRMIDQGTDGLSRGSLLEGVMAGKDMLAYIDLSKTAVERHPPLIRFFRAWMGDNSLRPLKPEEWFVEGHGIVGGAEDQHGVWIPKHASNGKRYLWCPPPVVADAALEEILKAVHKRTDATHVIAIPRLFVPRWRRLFLKACDFTFIIPTGHPHWPSAMHEPLFVGISLPFVRHQPWKLKGTPLLVDLDRRLCEVLSACQADGRDILRELLRIPRRIDSMPERLARGLLRLPGDRRVPSNEHNRRGRQCMAQTNSVRKRDESRD